MKKRNFTSLLDLHFSLISVVSAKFIVHLRMTYFLSNKNRRVPAGNHRLPLIAEVEYVLGAGY